MYTNVSIMIATGLILAFTGTIATVLASNTNSTHFGEQDRKAHGICKEQYYDGFPCPTAPTHHKCLVVINNVCTESGGNSIETTAHHSSKQHNDPKPLVQIETNSMSLDTKYINPSIYLNTTDGHYHIRGLVQNILPETRDGITLIIDIRDKSTDIIAHTVYGYISGPIIASGVIPFDVDIGYSPNELGQLTHTKIVIV